MINTNINNNTLINNNNKNKINTFNSLKKS